MYRNETFDDNPDADNPKYNTKFGMYAEKCGIENLTMSWGHDVSVLLLQLLKLLFLIPCATLMCLHLFS